MPARVAARAIARRSAIAIVDEPVLPQSAMWMTNALARNAELSLEMGEDERVRLVRHEEIHVVDREAIR
jgi:hypothetical protein